MLLERENFGYDFGAYRDALQLLRPRLQQTERLVLSNDSVWLALPGRPNWFAQAETLDADFVGAASNFGVTPLPPDRWPDQRWDYDPGGKGYHLCSFLLSFRPKVFRSDAFAQFWGKLALSNDKHWVVSTGEVALSRVLREAGFTSATTLPLHDLAARLALLSDARLTQLLGRLIIPEDPALRAVRDRVLEQVSPSSRKRTEAFILHAVAATGPAYALADMAVNELNQPFLKKSPLKIETSGAAASLAILREIGADDVLAEAIALSGKWPEPNPAL